MWMFNEDFSDDSDLGSMDSLPDIGFGRTSNSRKRKRPAEEKTGLEALSVAMLKNKCRELGLKVSGNKSDLIARIEAKEGGLPDPSTKKGKTTTLEITNKIREGLEHFFGKEVILAKPEHHEPSAEDPFSQRLLYDTNKHGEPFLEGSSAEDLRGALNDQEIFTVQGSLAMDPMISLGEDLTTGQQRPPLKFPAKKEDEPLLTQLSTVAPFGKGSETVIDKSVRNCRQISPEGFKILNNDWTKLFSTSKQSKILEEIRKILSPNNTEITAELYKFLYYPEGSFFKPHVDTQRDPNMFATLVVQLPSLTCFGGDLNVTHKGVTKVFTSESHNSASWMAFYASCEHSVDEVRFGFRCTLIYNLKRTGTEIPMEVLDQDAKIIQKLDKVFEEEDDITIGHLMDYQYAVSNVVPSVLKGMDARLYQAAKNSGKYDLMLVPIQIERTGCGGCGEENNKNMAEEFIDEDSDPQFASWVVDPSQPVRGGRNSQSYAAFTKDPLEAMSVKWMESHEQVQKAKKIARDIAPTGNEGVGALMFYIHAGLLISKKKDDVAKVFPAGLAFDAASTATNNNN
jgi:hypothetical protein